MTPMIDHDQDLSTHVSFNKPLIPTLNSASFFDFEHDIDFDDLSQRSILKQFCNLKGETVNTRNFELIYGEKSTFIVSIIIAIGDSSMNMNEIGNALEGLRDLQSRVEHLNEKEQLLDLRSILVDMQQEIMKLREENLSLQREDGKDLDRQKLLESLVEVSGYFYDKNNENGPVGYPYCPMCLRAENGPFKMLRLNSSVSICPNCNSRFRAGEDGKISMRRSASKSAFA